MKLYKWLENWDMTSLKINTPFLEMEWNPQTADKDAAWEMYVELLTRVTTQMLYSDEGDELSSLKSIHELFEITRSIIKNYRRDCIQFAKIAVVILNQVVRPFTAKWHRLSISGSFSQLSQCVLFRQELLDLQNKMQIYAKMLADMAGVEDLTELEKKTW